ncbi:MAG: glycoside hydrolase family 1 protein [Clostridiales bacterium]|nr:glycoside hydrolase family 1 protein [Clostridiales bacterium]
MAEADLNAFSLPEGFLMGTATAATQIEGGDTNNCWYDWSLKGRISDGSMSTRANDHWNRFKQDIDLMTDLKHEVYRMGLEWSRIEPEKGVFDEAAVKHYREELIYLKSKGIKPLLTLHHFSNPLWLEAMGGFENEASVGCFTSYVSYVIEQLGDLVEEYVTINEPNVYFTNGYIFGSWPPGKKSYRSAFRVMKNMTAGHVAAYCIIHTTRARMGFEGKTKVGVANALRVFDPAEAGNPLDYFAARLMQYLFQDAYIKSMTSGYLRLPIGLGRVKLSLQDGPMAVMNSGKAFCDFFGINYYTRTAAHFKGFKDDFFPGTEKNDLGWEIYPEGLSRLCRKYYKKYGLPIWITENGTCDRQDKFRARFIYDHLKEVSKLCNEGITIERYYHWTFIDNFEWAEGESAPFGLVALDFETQERTVRKSGLFFTRICEEKRVSDEMLKEYL